MFTAIVSSRQVCCSVSGPCSLKPRVLLIWLWWFYVFTEKALREEFEMQFLVLVTVYFVFSDCMFMWRTFSVMDGDVLQMYAV